MRRIGMLLGFLALLACHDSLAPRAVDTPPAAPSYQVLASSVAIENKAHTNVEDDDPSLTYDHPGQLYGDRGWYWATDTGNEWLPPLLNYLYDEDFLNEPQRFSYFGGAGEAGYFTQWTHAGRTLAGG